MIVFASRMSLCATRIPVPSIPSTLGGAITGIAIALFGCGLALTPRSEDRASMSVVALGGQAECAPRFPDQDGWLGGDAAASVALPHGDGRASLWLFGDSFVTKSGGPAERSYPFVHNSVALSHCDASGLWQIDYFWGGHRSAEPRAFFEPDPAAEWVVQVRRETGEEAYYWPISAAILGDAVYVALLRVAPGAASGPFQLPFRLLGVDLARINDTDRPPEAWRIRYAALASRADVLPASSLVADGQHLYAFAFLAGGDGHSPRILTRLPITALDAERPSLEDAVETLAQDSRWISGLHPSGASILMDDDASEMSVHFDPGLREWLAVYSDLPLDGRSPLTDTLWLRRARELTGPWSRPTPLAHVPELAIRPDPLPGELFCYAAKAHPELARSAELLVTYVCNVYAERGEELPAVLERLRTTPSIYRPRTLRLDVPPSSSSD